MSQTYKLVTLVGTSPESYEAAIRSAVRDASDSLRNLAWFEVQEMRGKLTGNQVAEFQVTLRVGFKVDVGS